MAKRSAAWFVYAGSIALHVALGIGALVAPSSKRHEAIAIALSEQKKPKREPKDEKPPPPPPPQPAVRAKSAPVAKPAAPPPAPVAAPPPAAAPAFADLGLTLGNGGGGGGMAVPQRAAAAAPAPQAAPTTTRKVTALAPKAEDTCDEAAVKPKPRTIVKPAYTEDARAAQVEGVVRVELTIDPTGQVVEARILRGLGHGLDEAALAAARQMTFEPGTLCGKAHVATISLGVRFALGS